ncbi:MAG: hypothetical protein ACNA8W_09800 [Bradymonadaceae bacterium]
MTTACGNDETAGKWQQHEPDADVSIEPEADVETEDDGIEDPTDDVGPPPELPKTIVSVDTIITSANPLRAGQRVEIACHFFDEDGERVEPEDQPETGLIYSPRASFDRTPQQDIIARRSGESNFACTVPSLGLLDPEPAVLVVIPGPLHTLTTTLDRHVITAGEAVTASCAGYDAFGNAIEDLDPTLRADIGGAGINIEGLTATITQTELYTLSCHVDGVPHVESAIVEVRPDLPAELLIDRMPDQPVYRIGQVIAIVHVVTDRFGNLVPNARVEVTSDPDGESFGDGRFRYFEEGVYTLTAVVTSPTLDDRELTAQTTVIINSRGPEISCEFPADGAMVNHAPGQNMVFEGRTADAHDVAHLSINGEEVEVGEGGDFSTILRPRYGINFVDIVAQDSFGEENVRTCAFLASSNWQNSSQRLDDGVNLRLDQEAIDDRIDSGPVRSLNDILRIALNSDGLHQALHEALLAANPLKPNSCDERWLGVCVLSSEVIYISSHINGPNTTRLSLVTNGLNIFARVENFGIRVRVRGRVSGVAYDTIMDASFDWAEIDLTSNLALSGGSPRVTLRQVNRVEVSTVRLSGSGFSGTLIAILGNLFNGTVRDMVKNVLRDYVEGEFNGLLDGLVSSLDVNALGSTFQVPRLDGSGHVNLGFNVGFSDLSVWTSRVVFGVGTRFTSQRAHAIPTLGVALPTGSVRLVPTTSGDNNTAATVHIGVLNHALHALWLGGFLHADVSELLFGEDLPDGAMATLQTRLPPVAVLGPENRVDLQLGAVRIALAYPGLFDEPLVINLGATARTEVSIVDDALSFGDVVIDEFHFSPESVTLNAESRDILDEFLRSLVQQLVDESLNSALPALPIPAFVLPASVGEFGLPAGRELGLTEPQLRNLLRHFHLEGTFGLR